MGSEILRSDLRANLRANLLAKLHVARSFRLSAQRFQTALVRRANRRKKSTQLCGEIEESCAQGLSSRQLNTAMFAAEHSKPRARAQERTREMSLCDIGLHARHTTVWALGMGFVAAAFTADLANGSVVAAWNLNGVNPAQSTLFNATTGTGTIDFSGFGAGATVLQGTTLGGQTGELAGDSLAALGTISNNSSMRVDFQTVGYLDLVLNFATRRSATGAAANRVEYWTASGWVTAAKFTSNATAWELVSLKLAAGDFLANGSASLRFVVDGATGSTGSIRFDNISVSGSAIPAPGAIALLGLAGVVSRRKR